MISIVGTRLAAAAALLFLLWILEVILPPTWFVVFVALALVFVPALSWMTFYFFARRAVLPDAPFTLRIRVQDALALAIASTGAGILGFIGLARVLNVLPPIGSLFVVGLAFVLLMIAAPAVNWLIIWKPWAKPEPSGAPAIPPVGSSEAEP